MRDVYSELVAGNNSDLLGWAFWVFGRAAPLGWCIQFCKECCKPYPNITKLIPLHASVAVLEHVRRSCDIDDLYNAIQSERFRQLAILRKIGNPFDE